MESQNQWRIR